MTLSRRPSHPIPRNCLMLALLALPLIGCSAGVNQGQVATSTPYPVRSPVTSRPTSVATPATAFSSALATGQAALRQGSPAAAERAFASALASDPTNADALSARSAASEATGDLPAAKKDLDAAIALAPSRSDLYLSRAQFSERHAAFATATEDYGAAIARDPGQAAAFVGRARVTLLVAQGDTTAYQAALDDFNRALALDSGQSAALLGRAQVLADRAVFRGDPVDLTRALDALDAIPLNRRGYEVALLRARVLAAKGDLAGAHRALDAPVVRTTGDDPVDEATRGAARAAVALRDGDWAGAASAASAALVENAATWDAYRSLAEAELKQGKPDGALRTADQILALWPSDGPSLYLRGLALIALGRDADGRRTLDAARVRLANSPVYQARIAQVLASPMGSPVVGKRFTGGIPWSWLRRESPSR